MRIPVHELKAGLSRYVARALAGEVVEITSHGQTVARLEGVSAAGPMGVSRLLARGAATWGGGKPALLAPILLSAGGKTASRPFPSPPASLPQPPPTSAPKPSTTAR